MPSASVPLPILAALYHDGVTFEPLLRAVADRLRADGLALAGLVQWSVPVPNRRKCDMVLEDVATRQRHGISQDRGALAQGCVLDTDRLLTAALAAGASLDAATDLLVLCKFGKAELEGGGLRGLVAEALDRDVPVLIGLPETHRAAFEAFAGGLWAPVDGSGEDPTPIVAAVRALIAARDLTGRKAATAAAG